MDKQKVYDECMGYAKDFVKSYLIDGVCELNDNGHIVLSYAANYLPIDNHYNLYDDLHRFIALSINGKHDTISLWRLKGQPLDSGLCSRLLLPLLDASKDQKDYQHILRIIFCMIKHGVYSKNDFVDELKDTTNILALLEIIKYDDFTVMTDSHRFEF